MKWKKLVVALYIFFIFIPNTYDVINAKGNILYVGGSGEGNYSKIQDAINDANDGDIIFVYDDSSPYYENIVIDKRISLIGENKYTTIIDGSKKDDVVRILEDGVKIEGFTIRNSEKAFEKAGIVVMHSNNVVIENNIIADNGDQGIRIYASNNVVIRKNIIANNTYYGIWLYYSKNNSIINNKFINNGIVLRESPFAFFFHHIENNTVNGKRLYYHYNRKNFEIDDKAGQIILVNCSNVSIKNIKISHASIGIQLTYSSHISILNGSFCDNNLNGIRLYYSNNNTISFNYLAENGWSGLSLWFSSNNLISHNTIDGNAYDNAEILFSSNGNRIVANIISNSQYGIGFRETNGNILRFNNIYGHKEFGMMVEKSVVDARLNWLGFFIPKEKIYIKEGSISLFPWLPFPNPFAGV